MSQLEEKLKQITDKAYFYSPSHCIVFRYAKNSGTMFYSQYGGLEIECTVKEFIYMFALEQDKPAVFDYFWGTELSDDSWYYSQETAKLTTFVCTCSARDLVFGNPTCHIHNAVNDSIYWR